MSPKYPVRKYLGKYESWLLKLYGHGALRYADRHLERFFSEFPKSWGLEDYAITDVEDYAEKLLASGKSEGVVHLRLTAVRRFWRWLIEDMGFELFNPVSADRLYRTNQKKTAPKPKPKSVYKCPYCGSHLKRVLEVPTTI